MIVLKYRDILSLDCIMLYFTYIEMLELAFQVTVNTLSDALIVAERAHSLEQGHNIKRLMRSELGTS